MKLTSKILFGVLVLSAWTNAKAGEITHIAGGDDGVWAVRTGDESSSHDVLFRPVGKQWKWVADRIQGSPVAIADSKGSLHVLYGMAKGYLVFSSLPDSSPSPCRKPESPYWPAGAKIHAFCDASELTDFSQASVLAIVEHPYVEPPATQISVSASKPASQPESATEPSPFGQPQPAWISAGPAEKSGPRRALGVFVNVNDNWKHVADLGPIRLADNDVVLAAVVEGKLFVLINFHGGQTKLASWQNQSWTEREMKSPSDRRSCRPAAIMNLSGRLTVIWECATPQTSSSGPKQASSYQIASRDENGEFSFREIMQGDSPAVFDAAVGPFFTRSGKHIAAAWKQESAWKLALCEDSGQIKSVDEINPNGSPPEANGKNYQDYFMYGLMISIFAVMFFVRPQNQPQTLVGFSLPKQFVAAGLIKRLAAGVIDLIPFMTAGFLVFPTDMTMQELFNRAMQNRMPDNPTLAVISGFGSYGVYCIVMERFFAATLGKMLFGLKVVANEGRPADTREILLRNLIKVMEISTLWLLLLIPLFNRNRQRLADLIARTAVIDKWQVQPPEEDEGDYI